MARMEHLGWSRLDDGNYWCPIDLAKLQRRLLDQEGLSVELEDCDQMIRDNYSLEAAAEGDAIHFRRSGTVLFVRVDARVN
jgi:hypothetical protein